MPEHLATELAKEAEQEAAVFSQATNVERFIYMLRAFDPTKGNLADDEEIQELYRTCIALRPKVVNLLIKYSQKRADLVSMTETFVRAQTIFDPMMEESLARHAGIYEQERPESRGIRFTQQEPVPYPSPSQQETVQQESLQNSASGFFSNCRNIVISGGTFILNVETPGHGRRSPREDDMVRNN